MPGLRHKSRHNFPAGRRSRLPVVSQHIFQRGLSYRHGGWPVIKGGPLGGENFQIFKFRMLATVDLTRDNRSRGDENRKRGNTHSFS